MAENQQDDQPNAEELPPDDDGATPSERARGKIGDASGTVKPAVGDIQRALPDARVEGPTDGAIPGSPA